LPVTKHNYLVKDPAQLPKIVRQAFHIAATGRPGRRGPLFRYKAFFLDYIKLNNGFAPFLPSVTDRLLGKGDSIQWVEGFISAETIQMVAST